MTLLVWRGQPIDNGRELLDTMCAIDTDEEAAEFMASYRAQSECADDNVGFVIGDAGSRQRREALYRRFGVVHPVFGAPR